MTKRPMQYFHKKCCFLSDDCQSGMGDVCLVTTQCKLVEGNGNEYNIV